MVKKASKPQFEGLAALATAIRELAREWTAFERRVTPTRLGGFQSELLHAIEQRPGSTMIELAKHLEIDKAIASRALATLSHRKAIRTQTDNGDGRRRILELTPLGRRLLTSRKSRSRSMLGAALDPFVSSRIEEQSHVLADLAKALRRDRMRGEFSVRPIEKRDDRAVAAIIRRVMTEHGASGAGFAIHDAEVGAMSKAYSRPGRRYFVVVRGRRVVGGGGIAPLDGADSTYCELRKMYFLKEARGLGLGADTLTACLNAASELGYGTCYLETLESMHAARALYEAFGFTKRCGPLGATGHFGCDAWYELDLTRSSAVLNSGSNAADSRRLAKR